MKKRFLYIAAAAVMAASPFTAMTSAMAAENTSKAAVSEAEKTETAENTSENTEKSESAQNIQNTEETKTVSETADNISENGEAQKEKTDESKIDSSSTESRFSDVSKDAWYADAVSFTVDRGVMNGTSKTTFSPDDKATRGTIALIIRNIDGTSEKVYWSYLDVPEDAWYADAIAWCSETGVMKGYGGGYFGPDDSITREQLVSILYRYAQYRKFSSLETTGVELLDYSDYAKVSGYAGGPMQWALKNKIISGKENNTLDPQGIATRAEIAQIIRNFMVFYNL